MYNKKEKLLNWFHIFMTIFQVMNFSIFIYLAFKVLYKDSAILKMESGYSYLIILWGLLLFTLIKVSLQLGNGFIFNSNKTISELIFKKLSYLNYSAIVMFAANVVLCYMYKDSEIVVYVAFFLILLINVIGWVTLLRNHQNFLASNFFYFILYLCALEIAPFVIIGSYLND